MASYTGTELYQQRLHPVTAGGKVDLTNCGATIPNADGFVSLSPDFSFELSQMQSYELEIGVQSSDPCDPIVLVNAADGSWHYNDDGPNGTAPLLTLPNQSELNGRIDVWVGNYTGNVSDCIGVNLTLETFNAAVAPTLACPEYGLTGQPRSYTGPGLQNGDTLPVFAGGDIDIYSCNDLAVSARGWVANAPDFSLNFSNMRDFVLGLSVNSGCDTVLLAYSADSRWYYDDDVGGAVPGGNAELILDHLFDVEGQVDVWVGTIDGQTCHGASLSVTTYPAHP